MQVLPNRLVADPAIYLSCSTIPVHNAVVHITNDDGIVGQSSNRACSASSLAFRVRSVMSSAVPTIKRRPLRKLPGDEALKACE